MSDHNKKKQKYTKEDTQLPYTYMVLEAQDGTFTCNVMCRGFSTYEDAVFFIELWDVMVNQDKAASTQLH
jgi:hypothetical protein